MRISAVIAAHDAEPWLGEAIDSALRELPADSELVAVDDGSTDGTPALLEGYRDRATLLRNDTARGPGFSRNRGAGAARGEILAFHDADDVVLPGRFSELAAVLESRPEVDLVFGNGFKIDETGHRLGPVIPRRYTRRLLQRCGPAEMLIGGFVYPQALSIRHERFESLGGFMHARVEAIVRSKSLSVSCSSFERVSVYWMWLVPDWLAEMNGRLISYSCDEERAIFAFSASSLIRWIASGCLVRSIPVSDWNAASIQFMRASSQSSPPR